MEIGDDDFALWYRDITEEPKKYDGKAVRFKGQVARLKKDRDGYFAPGRFVMTCCVEDIAFMGLPCKIRRRRFPARPRVGHGRGDGLRPLPCALPRHRSHPDGHPRNARRTREERGRNVLNHALV